MPPPNRDTRQNVEQIFFGGQVTGQQRPGIGYDGQGNLLLWGPGAPDGITLPGIFLEPFRTGGAFLNPIAVPATGGISVGFGGGAPTFSSGSGSPEGSVSAPPGSVYFSNSGSVYLKATGTGNTGWIALASGGVTTFQTDFIDRLNLSYVSASSISVRAGKCRDSADSTNLVLANDTTVTMTTVGTSGAAGELDKKRLSQTVTTHANQNAEASASIISNIGQRALSGLITTVGAALTGAGTKFLTELSRNDVIFTTSKGGSRILSVESDTAATLVAALPGGNVGGVAATLLENPTIGVGVGVGDRQWIRTIAADGLTMTFDANTTATGAGGPLDVGVETENNFYHVFVASIGGVVSAILSTQRTTPYLGTAWRRVGTVQNNATGDLTPFSQTGSGVDREMYYNSQGVQYRILSAGGSAVWADVLANWAPPSTRIVLIRPVSDAAVATRDWYFRPRGIGDSAVANLNAQSMPPAARTPLWVPTDPAQTFQYIISGDQLYIDLVAYRDDLTR